MFQSLLFSSSLELRASAAGFISAVATCEFTLKLQSSQSRGGLLSEPIVWKFFWARESLGSSDSIELSLPPALAEMSGRSVESESMIERVVLSKWPDSAVD
ncbi:unnamed protein product [Dovyalis caffra]|uniref:Secreted protein n=1 Tax=Dovyalis caffra TaxID=77055 RepID=A0AAV1QRN6_9ROSI|nr:unnamed protein product [Dovyalis caffra]